MTAADMLAAAGEPNTKEGRARFHKRFPSKAHFDAWYNQQNMARGGSPMVAVPAAFYQNGGGLTDQIGYPQLPTDAYMFEGASWSPSYKQLGGIAYPQQPTADVFFSGQGWTPQYADGGQYGGSTSPLGYGQMPPVMDFGGLTKGQKKSFVKQVVDGYVKAMGGSPSTRNKTFDTTEDYVEANKSDINRVLNNNYLKSVGTEIVGDAIDNINLLKDAGMAAYGQEMDWSSMINPQAQENYNMYTDMYNQGMADTKAGFKTGMNAVGNYVKSVGQSIAANKAAAMAYGGLPQAKWGDPIGSDPGNLFAKGKPFMPAPTQATNTTQGSSFSPELQAARDAFWNTSNAYDQRSNQLNAIDYLQKMFGNQQGINYGPNTFTFNPSYGDPFDYRGRNQYGKFRLRSYGPGIYNTQGTNMFFPGAPQAGFQGGNLTPEQLKQYQAMLPAGMKMDYKQKNRMFGLGPKSIEWSLRTGLPAEAAPPQVQLQDKAQPQQQAKQGEKQPAKKSFMDKIQSKLEERKQRKADERFQEENRLKPYYDEDPANNDVVVPGTPGSSGPNIKDTESFFPSSEAKKIEKSVQAANQPNPADPRQYAKDFNIFNTLSPGYGPGYSDGSAQTTQLPESFKLKQESFNQRNRPINPNDRAATGPVMAPFSQPGAIQANAPVYQPRPSISPVENTPTGPVMQPFNQPGGLAYGGYPMMYMGGYNMFDFGGQPDDEYTYMTPEEIAQFEANGGTIEYID